MRNMDRIDNVDVGAQAYRQSRAERSVGASKSPFQGGFRGMSSLSGRGGAKGRGRWTLGTALAFLGSVLLLATPASAELKIERITVKETPAQNVDRPTGEPIVIATAHYPLYCLAERLCRGTDFQVISEGCPVAPKNWASKVERPGKWFRSEDPCDAQFLLSWRTADNQDTTWDSARKRCPDIQELDASRLPDGGLALAMQTASQAPGYFWLSLANLSRMAELIAEMLGKRSPASTQILNQNLNAIKAELLTLQSDIAKRSATATAFEVQAMSLEWRYFTEALGLHLVGQYDFTSLPDSIPILHEGYIRFGLTSATDIRRMEAISGLLCNVSSLSLLPTESDPTFEQMITAYRYNIDGVFNCLEHLPADPSVRNPFVLYDTFGDATEQFWDAVIPPPH